MASKFHNAPNRNKPIEQAFFEKFYKDDGSGCWQWIASIGSHGYGQISTRSGPPALAHRYSYELFVGEIPEGSVVCHKCDNRKCVNPEHLFVGTQRDNIMDMIKKNRARYSSQRGEKNPSAKLSAKQALEIFRSDKRGADLAREYGVTPTMISKIRRGKSWTHVTALEK
mgnify:CR=1 FL=1